MDLNKIFQSKLFKGVIFGIAALIIILLVFKTGLIVGVRKADFSCRWSDNYHRNFGGPRGGFFKGLGDRDFLNANGTFGQIIKIDPSPSSGQAATLIIKGNNEVEKIILIKDTTAIQRLKETIKLTDLKIDDQVVVIGEPNNSGQIEAKLIRVLPAPADLPTPTPFPKFPMRPR